MENSDSSDLSQETIYQQYQIVKQETNTSTVCLFGDTSFQNSPVIDFLGGNNQSASGTILMRLHDSGKRPMFREVANSRLVEIDLLRRRISATNDIALRTDLEIQLKNELIKRAETRERFERIVAHVAGQDKVQQHMTTKLSLRDYSCVEKATSAFHSTCLNLGKHHWALEHTMSFVSMCADGVSSDAIVDAIQRECAPKVVSIDLYTYNQRLSRPFL